MARRGGSSDDYNDPGERTVPIISYSYADLDVAIIMGVATLFYVSLFIFSLFVASRHPKSHVWRLVAASLFFWILYSVLVMAHRIVMLTQDRVAESYFLISAWWVMFWLIANLLLLAACWGFLHNRLRAVGVRRKSVSVVAGLHWFFLATMSCLALPQAVGWWKLDALFVAAVKAEPLTEGYTIYEDYTYSVFYRVHLKNLRGAWIVLLWIWVLEMMVMAVTLAVKEANWKPAAYAGVPVKKTYASLIFLLCVLLPLFTATLGDLIMTFQYWDWDWSLDERIPRSTEITENSLEAFPTVAAFAGLCAVGMYLTRDQWARGNKKWDREQNQNYPPQQYGYPPQKHMDGVP